MRMRKLDRREFAQEAGLAFLAGVTVTVSACGGGGSSSGSSYQSPTAPNTSSTPAATTDGSKEGQISANHGHQAIITAAQLQAGGAVQLDIAYIAGHSHLVELPADAVQLIRDGHPVQKDSTTTDGHMHTVTFNAQVPEDPTRY